MLVVGLEPTCCLQHRILSPTGCLQPSKQSLLANALASMPSPDLGETRASFASIPPKLPEHYRFQATKTKKASGKTRGTLVLVVGLEPTCCLQHRILSPTRLPFHHTSTLDMIYYQQNVDVSASALSRASSLCLRTPRASFASIPPHQQSAYLIYHKPSQLSIVFTQFDKIFLPPRTFCAKNNAQPLLINRLCGKITK